MRRPIAGTATLVVLLALVGCGGDSPAPASRAADEAPTESATPMVTSELDGTWAAHITEKAFVDYAVSQGVRRRDTAEMVERDLPGPEFSLRLLDGRFNVTGPDGSSWQSGWFKVKGDELRLHEAPGFPPFRLVVERDGESVQFRVKEGQRPGPDHVPGVPMIVAGGALWCSVPWERVS